MTSLNKAMFGFAGVEALSDKSLAQSSLQHSMLFELSVARAEFRLRGEEDLDWQKCLQTAAQRQRKHFDARIPVSVSPVDANLAAQCANNLVIMLRSLMEQHHKNEFVMSPVIPGMGWIGSGCGDFSLGPMLIEVKHTDRNFVAADFRQVLMYWLLKYASAIEGEEEDNWLNCLLLNPRRNSALHFNFDYLIKSASSGLNRLELVQLLASLVDQDSDRAQ